MIYHVIPENDSRPHIEKSTCECVPEMREMKETGDMLIIHNSFDGREISELLDDLLNGPCK